MKIRSAFQFLSVQFLCSLASQSQVAVVAFLPAHDSHRPHHSRSNILATSLAASTRTIRPTVDSAVDRRTAMLTPLITTGLLSSIFSAPAWAYTPDPDPLRESLYLVCRVQEATCLQERYIEKSRPPIQKMKLTLRLVDKSYRLLDQVNFISKNIEGNNVVIATQLGNEAADALQEAIDFVYVLSSSKQQQQDGSTNMSIDQRDFLKASLTDTREKLFDFLEYLPPGDQAKLLDARNRVEEENKLNKDEFDPDLATDAGIFNPIVLPWKERSSKKV